MTTLPAWSTADWAADVAEPFRSDAEFWSSLAASADALVSLVASIAVAIVLAVTGHAVWALAPFVVPTALAIRAAVVGRGSSRRNQASFADRQAWREAERAAVATAFLHVVRHRRASTSR